MSAWNPSAEARAAAAANRGRYTNPPLAREIDQKYRKVTRTQLPIGRGTKALRNYGVEHFGIRTTYMPGRSRPMLDSTRLDAHQAGIAIDFMGTHLDTMANWLIIHGVAIGLQFLIWNRTQFSYSSRDHIGPYPGRHPHDDHIHMELNPAGAAGALDWHRHRNHEAVDGPSAPFFDHGAEGAWIIPVGIAAGTIVAGVAAAVAYRKLTRH